MLELCQPENLGPPACMLTTVGNAHTGAIVSFVKQGPFCRPNPDDTWSHLTQQRVLDGVTSNVVAAQKDYFRRYKILMQAMYPKNGSTGLRGQFINKADRGEIQQRGPWHHHVNEHPAQCGRKPELLLIDMTRNVRNVLSSLFMVPLQLLANQRLTGKQPKENLQITKSAGDVTKDKLRLCHGFSTLCLKTGGHCRHPKCANGVNVYTTNHLGYFTAELTRAYPVGSTTCWESLEIPEITTLSAEEAQRQVDTLFSQQRCIPAMSPEPQSMHTLASKQDPPQNDMADQKKGVDNVLP